MAATTGTYYFSSASFSNATALYLDEALSTFAPDGWYSDQTIYRQQASGILYAETTCPNCLSPSPSPAPISFDYRIYEACDGVSGTQVFRVVTAGVFPATVLYNNICFAKYKSNIEQNFPHTHKNTIFLSKKFLNRCIFFYNKNLEEDMIENFGVIIIHECVHLWQRKNKELFEKLYVYYWNFVRVNKIENNHLMKYYRFNPDGTDVNWVLNNKKNDKHILLMSLYSEDAKNLGHVDNVGVYLDKYELTFIMPDEENLKKENLNECNIFNELFENITSNNYHPNELSAELISIYYLQKMEISHYNFDNKALQKLENWFNKEVLK